MITERDFLDGIAEIILSVFENQQTCLTKREVCSDGHFSPRMLTPQRLLCMRSDTLMRLLLYLATTMRAEEFYDICGQICRHIVYVAEHDEVSAYNIIDRHAGSSFKR